MLPYSRQLWMMLSRLYLEERHRNVSRLKFPKGSPKRSPLEGRIAALLLFSYKASHEVYQRTVITCEMKYGHYLKAHGGSTGTTVSGMSFNGSAAILEPCCLSPASHPPPWIVAGSATLWLTVYGGLWHHTQ